MLVTALFSALVVLPSALANPLPKSELLEKRLDFVKSVNPNSILRILPLGASITFGTNSGSGNGYRKTLRDLLVQHGKVVNMIGSVHGGNMCDNEVEGWPGFIIDQVAEKAKLSAPQKPNVILINAGTNDCGQNVDIDNAHIRLGKMLDYLYTTSPGTTIVVSTLLHNGNADVEARVEKVNKNYVTYVNQRQANGDKILLVDMQGPNAPLPSEITDGTHPNDAGYDKMANIWFQAIQDATQRGWITKPASTGVPDSGDKDDCSAAR